MDNFILVTKILLGFTYAIVIMKLSGKANLAPISPIDQINNYILGGIVGSVLFNRNISFYEFFFVLTVWAIITLGFNYLRKKTLIFKRLIDGEQVDVIKHGEIIRSGIEKAKITVPDLYLKLRLQGVYDIKTVDLARVEQNGQLVILTEDESLPRLLVVDKVINDDELERAHKDREWLNQILKQNAVCLDEIASIELYEGEVRINTFA